MSISQHLPSQLLGSRMTRAQKFKVGQARKSVIGRSSLFWAWFPKLNRWYRHLWIFRKDARLEFQAKKGHLDRGAKVASTLSETLSYQ